MTLLPIAAGNEGIIWVIILIVWSIVQFVQKSRAAQRRPPMRPPGAPPPPPLRPTVPMETDLQELLRELTGQPSPLEQEDEVEEEEPIRPEPPPVRSTPPAPRPAQQLVQTLSTVTARRAELEQTGPAKEPLPQYVPSIGDLSEGKGSAFSHTGKMPGLIMKMPSVSLRGISYRGSSHPGQTASGGFTFDLASLRNRNTLRQMVIGQMILGKPKALDLSPSAGAQ